MNPIVTKVRAVLPSVKNWIDQTLQAHANAASSVSSSGYARLRNHYPDPLLARARVVVV